MNYAQSLEEAKERFEPTRDFGKDPLDIPPSLLSTFHIRQYVEATGMLYPFSEDDCKTATVKGKVGGEYKYWEDAETCIAGTLTEEQGIGNTRSITLKSNSIAYVPIDLEFLLPDYIAARFNLMIDYVYKGFLLGTAPLVGPGYEGKIWIPLHNLTAKPYTINVGDELIRIEFTKIFCPTQEECKNDLDYKNHRPKPGRTLESFIGDNIIVSSIPDAIKSAEESAEKSAYEAEEAHKTQLRWSIGTAIVIAIAAFSGMWAIHRESVEIRQMINENTIKIVKDMDSTVTGDLDVTIDSASPAEIRGKLLLEKTTVDESNQTAGEQSDQATDKQSGQPSGENQNE